MKTVKWMTFKPSKCSSICSMGKSHIVNPVNGAMTVCGQLIHPEAEFSDGEGTCGRCKHILKRNRQLRIKAMKE